MPPDRSKIHRTVAVTMKNGFVKQCRGGIDVQSILTNFSTALDHFFVILCVPFFLLLNLKVKK